MFAASNVRFAVQAPVPVPAAADEVATVVVEGAADKEVPLVLRGCADSVVEATREEALPATLA